MTNLLVIGATGNIGQPLIRDLQDDPDVHLFAGVHNSEHVKQALNGLKVQVRRFDFLDPATFEQALADIDKVFFVRPPQLAKPKEDMYPFLDALVARHVKQVVFVSLLGVAHNPMTPHHQIEKRIVELGLPYTFIRPSFFMQNLNTTHQADIVGHRDLFVPAGHARTSFIDTRDIGATAAVVLRDPAYIGQKLDITGAQALTYADAAQIMT
ncbi:nucleoside-diphosphate-sugar epimerase, partial [Lacticaseibacillus paracasei subsp. paracasei Lpp70]